MEQSSIDWFFRWINDNPEATIQEYAEAYKTAKKKHNIEIIDAIKNFSDTTLTDEAYQEYYQETFELVKEFSCEFISDDKSSSATLCICGLEKWQHS